MEEYSEERIIDIILPARDMGKTSKLRDKNIRDLTKKKRNKEG